MKFSEILKTGFKQLKKKKEIHNLKSELAEKREELSKIYLQIGMKVGKSDLEELNKYDEITSMKNVMSIIEKLEKENLELEEKIDITKEDYNRQIESYTPLIVELKENLSIPQAKLAKLKDELNEIKKSLKEIKDKIKEKENIFQDTQKRINNKSEEDDLDDEKIEALEKDKQRLQKELLEMTQLFEEKTEKQNEIKENIRIVNEEIKTAEEQINNYKKEIGRLKKEKSRELDAIKKIISSNKNSIENRTKELENIYKNIGNLMYDQKIQEDNFIGFYNKIDAINEETEKINQKIQDLTIKLNQTGNKVIIQFFAIIISIILIIFFIIFLTLKGKDKSNNTSTTKKEQTITATEIKNQGCNKGELIMKIPQKLSPPFSVKSTDLFSKIKLENNMLKVIFSADEDTQKDVYELHIFGSGKEFTKYKIRSKLENNKCLKFYMDN